MRLEGGCYCGALRYVAEGEPALMAQCHCRACQHISGGAPNAFLLMPPEGFRYATGTPKTFARPDLERAVTRAFCAECGTHVASLRPGLPWVVLKAGTLDDPTQFGGPQMAVFTQEKQAWHLIPEGIPAFEAMPPR